MAVNGPTSRHEKTTIPDGQPASSADSTTVFQQHIFSSGLEYEAQIHPRVKVAAGVPLDGAALGKFVPNPRSKPVTTWIGEVGLERQKIHASFGATVFGSRVHDTIDKRTFQDGPNAGKEQRSNLQGARIYGLETTAR